MLMHPCQAFLQEDLEEQGAADCGRDPFMMFVFRQLRV